LPAASVCWETQLPIAEYELLKNIIGEVNFTTCSFCCWRNISVGHSWGPIWFLKYFRTTRLEIMLNIIEYNASYGFCIFFVWCLLTIWYEYICKWIGCFSRIKFGGYFCAAWYLKYLCVLQRVETGWYNCYIIIPCKLMWNI